MQHISQVLFFEQLTTQLLNVIISVYSFISDIEFFVTINKVYKYKMYRTYISKDIY